ncbi:MAG: hypothetical protein EXR66_02700 [Dehalococcoidia bacterium]|nr:hypothetical protein [Dehalococcoidia bacterium]
MQPYIQKLQDRYVDQPVKWATVAGLVLLLLGGLGPWYTINVLVTVIASSGGNGGLILLLALGGLGVLGAYVYANVELPLTTLLWVLVGLAATVDVFVTLSFLDALGSSVGIGWGLWLAIVGAVAFSVGAILPMWNQIRDCAQSLQRGNTE